MKAINDIVTCLLIFVNVLGSILIYFLMLHMNGENNFGNYSSPRKLALNNHIHSNLRGTQINLIKLDMDIKNKISKTNNKLFMNSYYQKKLRKLETPFEHSMIIYLCYISFFSSLILIFSYCSKENCSADYRDIGDCGIFGRVNCLGGGGCCIGGDLASCCLGLICIIVIITLILIFVFIISIIFLILFFAVKFLGRKVSRYIGIIGELILNLAILVFILYYIFNNKNDYHKDSIIICVISSTLVLSNFLVVLFSNLSLCEKKADNANEDIKNPLNSSQQPITINPNVTNNSTIISSPIDTNQKDNNENIPIKIKDDPIKSQEGVDDAPPSVQQYPQPQPVNEPPSEQDIISSEIPKEQ